MKRALTPLAEQLASGLERLAAVARRKDWRTGEAEGLTPTQGDILRLVLARGGVRLSSAAAHAGVSQPTASDAVAALERKGLIEKRADPRDGRALVLKTTRSGRALAGRWPNSFEPIAAVIPEADQARLLGIVVAAIRELERRGEISPQRMCVTCWHFVAGAHSGARKPNHCRLLGVPIGEAELRIDCPEHESAHAA